MKRWWKSKTVWWNIGTGATIIGAELMAVAEVLPPEWPEPARAVLVAVMSGGNVILRFVTREPIA